jgi:putative transcriptional regulator
MKRGSITWVEREPGDPLPELDVDWEMVNAMTDEEVIARALSDPDAPPLTDEQLAKMERVFPDVAAIRDRLGLTQEQFAQAFRIPIGTLRDWEQRRKRPDAPARALLRVIEREPEAVRRALAA